MARFSVIENFDYEDLKLPLGASDSSDTASAPLLPSTVFCMQQGDKQTDIQDQELYEDCTLQDDNDDEDFELFLSASDTESSDEDGYYDQADSFMEEDQLEETDIFGEENMDADGVNQSLETLVRRSGFLEKCEQWRHRSM
ncbi:uncharacterized protein LOC143753644 [Siphateles boraxobius]|uniref:uncharacterized protein LOC143753644 n=1 Tax=Siphateles boraxobius TaxID=180520 RepID=UPI004064B2C9